MKNYETAKNDQELQEQLATLADQFDEIVDGLFLVTNQNTITEVESYESSVENFYKVTVQTTQEELTGAESFDRKEDLHREVVDCFFLVNTEDMQEFMTDQLLQNKF